ncbi:transcriptional regulator SplA domain-containing protein [Alkalihalophilus pseudofirmus]|jgi:transcriptional regulator of the spore photoproduct lyase operon|uniref:Transcriptional regulator SplA domain-containing protein n=2 Tax=Alkalihalophilus TaxID=2893060 RepID=A0AAJ2U2S5_ALKPS|nr:MULTISPECIES: transcriptional regulator SplA domain-containing protein [Alkalihalophilus]ERN52226.1 transcriptional regulator [Alkalihalophilus marmarensis DSM 21297]MCM3491559.1 transcriptional regulator [Alkalihalophilus marmarensis]MDV2886141.1 transcriptional regulator SplA domain-containing protein [Alkalihalophilus pseudofirmus]MED1600062.1 transcriptional regulator SplA domain-containing protein [Alkalihalophilus marmarensis]WEG16429.1 transcriptional regulator SplA domain-containing
MLDMNQLHEGQSVYVIYRNPHTPTVSSIQEATIALDPMNPGQMSLVLFDYYHPIEEDDAIFSSYEEAEASYDDYFM